MAHAANAYDSDKAHALTPTGWAASLGAAAAYLAIFSAGAANLRGGWDDDPRGDWALRCCAAAGAAAYLAESALALAAGKAACYGFTRRDVLQHHPPAALALGVIALKCCTGFFAICRQGLMAIALLHLNEGLYALRAVLTSARVATREQTEPLDKLRRVLGVVVMLHCVVVEAGGLTALAVNVGMPLLAHPAAAFCAAAVAYYLYFHVWLIGRYAHSLIGGNAKRVSWAVSAAAAFGGAQWGCSVAFVA